MTAPVWVVDDDASIRWVVNKALARSGIETRPFESADECMPELDTEMPAILITDLRMPGASGMELLRRLGKVDQPPAIIVISAHSDLDTVLEVYAGGAVELLAKPFDVDELVSLVTRLLDDRGIAHEPPVRESRRSEETPRAETLRDEPAPGVSKKTRMVGDSPAMQELFRVIGRIARTSIPVLVTGESGTGKELVARTLHDSSPRAGKPFVALNTAAIPGDLLESELFGHERGAFTGATERRIGRFEQAHEGTLFLDEIGDMPIDMQTRLLRVLSEGEFFRVGGREPISVDVRIIAATHQDLAAAVKNGRFREDLYHRLNVVSLRTPPLRDRPEDIPALIDLFLQESSLELATARKTLSDAAIRRLADYPWPGNVRELRNYCRRLTALVAERRIDVDALEPIQGEGSTRAAGSLDDIVRRSFDTMDEGVADSLIPDLEIRLIREALKRTGGHKQEAAKLLGWGRNTLTRKLQRYKLEDYAE